MKKVWKWVGISLGILAVLVIVGGAVVYILVGSEIRAAKKTAIEQELIPAGVEETIAFVDINVIPMDSERILESQTVIIENGRITQLGPSEDINPPDNAIIIDGKGQFLIPGLSDMHVHLFGSENDLLLNLANGVTTIREMGDGPSEYLEWRDEIKAGTRTGPNLWVWSPAIKELRGFGVIEAMVPAKGVADINKPEDAEKLVAKFAAQGYDGIKIKLRSVDISEAVIEAAERHGLQVDAHAPSDLWAIGDYPCEDREECWNEFINMDLEAVAHLEELLRTIERSDESILKAAQDVAEDGIWVTTTNILMQSIAEQITDLDSLLAQPEIAYLNPSHFSLGWLPGENYYSTFDMTSFSEYLIAHKKMLLALNEAGVPMMSGTDTPLPVLVPGFALQEELALMVEIGLSPYDALKTSTYNPAKYLGELDEFGTVEVGKRADLVLLQANPLEDITNTQKIEGVMVRGKWYSRADLDTMLEEVAKANQK